VKSSSDAEDLFQDSFLKAYRFLHQFRGGSAKGWLRRIVVTTHISSSRGFKRMPALPLEESGLLDLIPDASAGPADLAERTDAARRLRLALQELPADARTVLVLREFEGLDYEGIAETLKINKGTVRSRLARAREALRHVLVGPDGGAEGRFGV
jgi:RNA polymerase sigma-70 factor (ECF subfamily)